MYRTCVQRTHHHHLVCRYCGRTVEIAGASVENWAGKVAAENSFIDIRHTVELLGTCALCAAERASHAATQAVSLSRS